MTRYTEGPSDRFNDIDGYYQREPATINLRTDEELGVFLVHMHTLHETVAALDAVLEPEHAFLAEQIRAELRAMVTSSKLLLGLLHELRTYNEYLLEQRQSARQAFEAGYEARMTDILTRLHPSDRKALEWVLKFLDRTDKEAEAKVANRMAF